MTTTTMGKLETTLHALAQIAPPQINAMCAPGVPHCVAATAIGQMVLGALGIPALPFPVQFTICNQAWMDWAKDDFPGGHEPGEQLRRGAYILSNAPDWKGPSFMTKIIKKPWDGHLVLTVASREWTGRSVRYLIDLDLGSYSRPQHGIVLPLGFVAAFHKDHVVGTLDNGGQRAHLAYQPLVAPYAEDYQQAKDWTARYRYTGVVADIVRAMKGHG